MTRHDIAALAFKLTGILVLVHSAELLESLVFYLSLERPPGGLNVMSLTLAWLLLFAVKAAFGCVLIVSSRRFATWMFPEDKVESPTVRVVAIQTVAFSVVGIVLITYALSDVGALILQFVSDHGLDWSYTTDACLRLLFGIALFFGAAVLARFWSKMRYAGLRRELGLCIHCAYDLTGNTSGVCPECGTPIDTAADLRSDSTEHE